MCSVLTIKTARWGFILPCLFCCSSVCLRVKMVAEEVMSRQNDTELAGSHGSAFLQSRWSVCTVCTAAAAALSQHQQTAIICGLHTVRYSISSGVWTQVCILNDFLQKGLLPSEQTRELHCTGEDWSAAILNYNQSTAKQSDGLVAFILSLRNNSAFHHSHLAGSSAAA